MNDAIDRCLTPQTFWRSLEYHGLSPTAVLKHAGLPASLPLNAGGYVTTAQVFAIWRAVEALAGDPGFAIRLAESADSARRKPALIAAHFAASYRDALLKLAGFKRYGGCFQLRFEETGGAFAIAKDWLFAAEPEPALSVDASFTSLLELGRRGTRQRIVPLRVECMRTDPKTETHEVYFGCPIFFGAPRNRLVLRSEDVDLPFPGCNPELFGILATALTQTPGPLQAQVGIGERVKSVLKQNFRHGRTEVADVARDLAISARTLQRRIAEEGATFRGLLLQARQELGRRLLTDPEMEIEKVAGLLGYESASAFSRAFREWERTTPSRWRAGNSPAR
jgi:AraC-like DNA-binding protein